MAGGLTVYKLATQFHRDFQIYSTASTGKEHSMSLFKTWAELTQESRYTRSKKKWL